DPEGETQMVEAAESDSGPLSAPTEVFYASSTSLPWPKRPYLPDEHAAYARQTPKKRNPWIVGGAVALPLLVGVGWWAGSAGTPAPATVVEAPASEPPFEVEAPPEAPPLPIEPE